MLKVAVKAETVKAQMATRNLSLTEMAKLAGLSKGALSLMLSRQRNVGPDARRRLMRALKVKPDAWDTLFEVVEQ
jgi:transcriptional regulator with XRE-family HTH domain